MAGTRTKQKDHKNKTVNAVFTGKYLHLMEVRRLKEDYLRGRVSDKDLVQKYEKMTKNKK